MTSVIWSRVRHPIAGTCFCFDCLHGGPRSSLVYVWPGSIHKLETGCSAEVVLNVFEPNYSQKKEAHANERIARSRFTTHASVSFVSIHPGANIY